MDAPVLASRAAAAGEQFERNADAQRQLVEELRARLAEAALGGPVASRERHVGRGKLLPRERVDGLLDPGSPLLELSPLAANGMYGGDVPGAGIITGVVERGDHVGGPGHRRHGLRGDEGGHLHLLEPGRRQRLHEGNPLASRARPLALEPVAWAAISDQHSLHVANHLNAD